MEDYKGLMSSVECGEITEEEFKLAQNIEFNISDEDALLFIQAMSDKLASIKSVAYASIKTEYDGAYEVLMTDGSVEFYGWFDADTLSLLYLMN